MSLGISDIYVSKKPSISIIITGDELVSNGKQIELGQIYESNSVMIKNCLIKEGINNLKIFKTKDNLELISKRIKKEITKSDIIILSGGISVGDYDFVRKALKQNKIKQIFYKVKQNQESLYGLVKKIVNLQLLYQGILDQHLPAYFYTYCL